MIVENVGGAGGTIGVARVARAAPDGYTINFGNVASHVFSSIVYKLPFDVLKDLQPIALLTISPLWIIARNGLPAKDVKELVGWLKANPGKATWGIVGPGSPAHLCGVYFQNHTGTRFQFVPYRGAGPVIQDLVAGQIDLSCIEASASRPSVQSGKIKAYALLAKNRWAASPTTPTMDEAGVPGLYLPFWHGMWVPSGTPADVIAKLNGALVEALADPALRSRLTTLGVELAAARTADARRTARSSPGRDRQVAADHRSCPHQAGVKRLLRPKRSRRALSNRKPQQTSEGCVTARGQE